MMPYEKSATWKEQNMEKVQHEKIQIPIMKYGTDSAQTGNGPFVDGPLYTGMKKSIFQQHDAQGEGQKNNMFFPQSQIQK